MDRVKIGERLRKLRGSRSQEEVAEAIGITSAAISQYENGERIPKDEIKKSLAEYYKRSVGFIFFSD